MSATKPMHSGVAIERSAQTSMPRQQQMGLPTLSQVSNAKEVPAAQPSDGRGCITLPPILTKEQGAIEGPHKDQRWRQILHLPSRAPAPASFAAPAKAIEARELPPLPNQASPGRINDGRKRPHSGLPHEQAAVRQQQQPRPPQAQHSKRRSLQPAPPAQSFIASESHQDAGSPTKHQREGLERSIIQQKTPLVLTVQQYAQHSEPQQQPQHSIWQKPLQRPSAQQSRVSQSNDQMERVQETRHEQTFQISEQSRLRQLEQQKKQKEERERFVRLEKESLERRRRREMPGTPQPRPPHLMPTQTTPTRVAVISRLAPGEVIQLAPNQAACPEAPMDYRHQTDRERVGLCARVNQFGERPVLLPPVPRQDEVPSRPLKPSSNESRCDVYRPNMSCAVSTTPSAELHSQRRLNIATPPTPVSATFDVSRSRNALPGREAQSHSPAHLQGPDQLLTALAFDPIAHALSQRSRTQQPRMAAIGQQRLDGCSSAPPVISASQSSVYSNNRRQKQSNFLRKINLTIGSRKPAFNVQHLGTGLDGRALYFRFLHTHNTVEPGKLTQRPDARIDANHLESLVAPYGEMLWHTYFRVINPNLPIINKHQLPLRTDSIFPTTLLAVMYLSAMPHLPSSFRGAFILDGRWTRLANVVKMALIEEAECADLVTVTAFLHYLHLPTSHPSDTVSHYNVAGCNVKVTNSRWNMTTLLLNCAYQLGLHLDPGRWTIPDSEKRMRRLLWWMTMTIEKWNSLICGRRSTVRAGEYRVEMFAISDFEDELASQDCLGPTSLIANAELALLLADILEVVHNNPNAPSGFERLMLTSLLNFRAELPALNLPEQRPLTSKDRHRALCHVQLHLSFLACWVLILKTLLERPTNEEWQESVIIGQMDLPMGLECIAEYCKLLDICASIGQLDTALWPSWTEHSVLLMALFAVRLVAGASGPAQEQSIAAVADLYRALLANRKSWHLVEAPLRLLVETGVVSPPSPIFMA